VEGARTLTTVRVRPDVLLLDMGNTFMFGCDRFSDASDFEATYHSAGGRELTGGQLRAVLDETLARMDAMYVDPAYYDAFPSVRDVMATCRSGQALSDEELDRIEVVFARHEVGTITSQYVRILEQLAERWRLGVVSNVWAPSHVFRETIERASVLSLFDVVVFSSDHACIKPSARLFWRALEQLRVVPERVWYVGDDLRCDVGGARRAGLRAIWINPGGQQLLAGDPVPDRVIRNLGDLLRDSW
jgi:HAD superfamily hydrolase (TIGR01549 family)